MHFKNEIIHFFSKMRCSVAKLGEYIYSIKKPFLKYNSRRIVQHFDKGAGRNSSTFYFLYNIEIKYSPILQKAHYKTKS